MAISLTSLRNELLPGLDAIERRTGQNIVAYQEFNRDVLVIKAGDQTLEITRAEMEDSRHLAKLGFFLEMLMCVKVAGNTVSTPPPDDFYRALELTKAAVRDNLFLAGMTGPYNANVTPLAEPLKPIEPAKPSWPPAPDLILSDEDEEKPC